MFESLAYVVFAQRLIPIENPFGLIAPIKDADAAIAL